MTALHGYHAHVYFDDASRTAAGQLKTALAQFNGKLSPDMEEIGPHPVPQFAMMFKPDEFSSIIPWLMFNRNGLSILVHPLTENQFDDHTANALWLGPPINLKLETLPKAPYPSELLPA